MKMNISGTAVCCFLLLGSFAQRVSYTHTTETKAAAIEDFVSAIYSAGQFMGAVLVAENGNVIYKKGFGVANTKTNERFTASTPCYIGSLSKQFTAMGIVILKEKGKLAYTDPVRRYFPSLPKCYQPVTILDLLHHTSGLALFDDFPDMTTQDVLDILRQQTSLRFSPGSKFEYCNANYTLLGLIIEKISGKSLDSFLTANIFAPCKMNNTYVDEPLDRSRSRATGYYLFGDEYNYNTYIGGAASIVSTAEDLYKWDQMLYHPTIISKRSLQEVFAPGKNTWQNERYGRQGYGFGWFISGDDTNKIIQHDGGFAGFRSYIERQVNKRNTIIVISNVRHGITSAIREGLANILENKPYTVPKMSAANWIMSEAKRAGMRQAILNYQALTSTKDSSKYYFSERECNSLGYYLLKTNRTEDAIELFRLNTVLFPQSPNVYDSMGEAYLKAGDKKNALVNYEKVLMLDPGNKNAAATLKQLSEEKIK